MGFELPDGKTARNIQEQVAFLTEKVKEIIAAMGEMKVSIKIVAELPEEGESLTIYFVPSTDPDLENVYKEFMWIDEQWEMIGSTEIDLSDYYTKEEAEELVKANPTLAGTEDPLAGLEVNGTKYKVESGGKMYLHRIAVGTNSRIEIINSSSTPFTNQMLAEYLYNNGYTSDQRAKPYNFISSLLQIQSSDEMRIFDGIFATSTAASTISTVRINLRLSGGGFSTITVNTFAFSTTISDSVSEL